MPCRQNTIKEGVYSKGGLEEGEVVHERAGVIFSVLLQPPNGQTVENHLLHKREYILRLYFVKIKKIVNVMRINSAGDGKFFSEEVMSWVFGLLLPCAKSSSKGAAVSG